MFGPEMVIRFQLEYESPYEWKTLEWDDKHQKTKQNKQIN